MIVLKKIMFMLMVIFSVIGLSACSSKSEQSNHNSNSQDMIGSESKAEGFTSNDGKGATANDNDIRNEKTDDSSVAAPDATTLDEKRIIQDQSFNVELDNWGNVRFVSYEPDNSVDFEDVSFFLTKEDVVVYSFPYYCENNSTENYVGLFDSVEAVDFCDVNNDHIKDVIVIINYVTGAGPQGMTPRPRARIFLADNQKLNQKFNLATDLINDITNNIEEKDLTISTIREYLKNK